MAKLGVVKMISLDAEEQLQAAKQTRKPRKRNKGGEMSVKVQKKLINADVAQSRGLIYISHIPHQFYELQMKNYFQQFGVVTNVKLCRSHRGSKGYYGYVEFSHPEVAKIATDTLNNYMSKKKLVAEYLPFEKRPRRLFQIKGNTPRYSPKPEIQKQMAEEVKDKIHLRRSSARLVDLSKKLQKTQNDLIIDCDADAADLPDGIKQEKCSDEAVTHAYQAESVIEARGALEKSRRSLRSVVRRPSLRKSVRVISSTKSQNKSKGSLKSKLDDAKYPVNKMYLAKSLDCVKAMISSKIARKTLKSKCVLKADKATSIGLLKTVKIKNKKSRAFSKKAKKLNMISAETIRKIARELIRKRGYSLLKIITTEKTVPRRKPVI